MLSGVTRKVNLEEDLAFKLNPSNLERSSQILSKHGVNVNRKPVIGVNLRTLHPNVRQEVVNVMSEFLDWLIMGGFEVVFIPFGYGSTPERFFDDDLIVVNELKKQTKYAHKLKVINAEYKPQDLLGIFRFFDLFIGMRFHSIIFSTITDVPTVAIIYDTKIAELLKKRKIWHCISISVDELDAEALKEATKTLLSSYM